MKITLLVVLALMTQVPTNLTAGRAIVVFVDDVEMEGRERLAALNALKFVRDLVLKKEDWFGAVSTGRSAITVDLQPDPDHKRFDAMMERLSRIDLPAAPSKEASYYRGIALVTLRDVVTNMSAAATERERQIIVLTDPRRVSFFQAGLKSSPSESADAEVRSIFLAAERAKLGVRVIDVNGFRMPW
jgi:hypothetical protein